MPLLHRDVYDVMQIDLWYDNDAEINGTIYILIWTS